LIDQIIRCGVKSSMAADRQIRPLSHECDCKRAVTRRSTPITSRCYAVCCMAVWPCDRSTLITISGSSVIIPPNCHYLCKRISSVIAVFCGRHGCCCSPQESTLDEVF